MDSLPIRAIRVIRGHEADAHALEWADVSRRLQWCLTSPMLAALSHAPPAPSRSLSRRRFLRTAAAAGLTAPVILPSGLLLGTVAIRVPGQRLEWDAKRLRFPNCPEAEPHLKRTYREGWRVMDI